MPLNLFYTMVQKSQKWPKTQIKGGGPALTPTQFASDVACFHSRRPGIEVHEPRKILTFQWKTACRGDLQVHKACFV